MTYRNGSTDDVRVKLLALDSEVRENMAESLAYLAVKDGKPDLLEICFEADFRYEGYFEREANAVDPAKYPETFAVIEQSQFRKVYPRREPANEVEETNSDSGIEDDEYDRDRRWRRRAARAFDVGGSHPVEW